MAAATAGEGFSLLELTGFGQRGSSHRSAPWRSANQAYYVLVHPVCIIETLSVPKALMAEPNGHQNAWGLFQTRKAPFVGHAPHSWPLWPGAALFGSTKQRFYVKAVK
jgi:hypothetical protein